MKIIEYINWRIKTLEAILEASSGIVGNDLLDDVRLLAQINELKILKEKYETGILIN